MLGIFLIVYQKSNNSISGHMLVTCLKYCKKFQNDDNSTRIIKEM